MRQVPETPNYLIIGNGKLATNLTAYLKEKNIPHRQWYRKSPEDLSTLSQNASHILFAITDSSIASFYKDHEKLWKEKICIHFSGALSLPELPCVHPPFSFPQHWVGMETFEKVPFTLFHKNHQLSTLMPGFCNPQVYFPEEQKALYHALCVCIGNLPQLLWFQSNSELKKHQWDIKNFSYLVTSSFENSLLGRNGLSGPIARNDHRSIEKNLSALPSKLKSAYTFFLENHFTTEEPSL